MLLSKVKAAVSFPQFVVTKALSLFCDRSNEIYVHKKVFAVSKIGKKRIN